MATDADRKPETPIDVYIYIVAGELAGAVVLLHPVILVSWWWTPLMDALREGERAGVWKPALVLLSVMAGVAGVVGGRRTRPRRGGTGRGLEAGAGAAFGHGGAGGNVRGHPTGPQVRTDRPDLAARRLRL